MTDWFDETLHAGLNTRYRSTATLFDSQTAHQRLVLFENPTFGRMLMLDGATQTTEADEFIYHEMLAHVPILAHGAAKRVLIIGGGDGGCLREVLRHPNVARVTQVEIDAGVVEFSKTHLGAICQNAYDDPRLDLVIDDGLAYVARDGDNFDVILVDSTDPQGPGAALFSDRFYRACRQRLNAGGILVTQTGVPFMQPEELRQTARLCRQHLAVFTCYLITVPTYVGGAMALGFGSDDPTLLDVSEAKLRERYAQAGLATRYYTPAVHRAAFALPPYVGELLEG